MKIIYFNINWNWIKDMVKAKDFRTHYFISPKYHRYMIFPPACRSLLSGRMPAAHSVFGALFYMAAWGCGVRYRWVSKHSPPSERVLGRSCMAAHSRDSPVLLCWFRDPPRARSAENPGQGFTHASPTFLVADKSFISRSFLAAWSIAFSQKCALFPARMFFWSIITCLIFRPWRHFSDVCKIDRAPLFVSGRSLWCFPKHASMTLDNESARLLPFAWARWNQPAFPVFMPSVAWYSRNPSLLTLAMTSNGYFESRQFQRFEVGPPST